MKKRIVIIGMTFLLCCMGGCLQDVPLTDAEMNAVAEHAAGLLLKHDVNYTSSLLPDDVMAELLTPSPTPSPVPTKGPGEQGSSAGGSSSGATVTIIPEVTEETNAQLTELFAQEGLQVSYDRYEISDSVVSSNYYVLEAKEGCTYITTYFTIMNPTQEELVFDASGKKITYVLDVDMKSRYRAALSMLENDMQYMELAVPAGQSKQAVLVFEIKKAETEIEQLHLIFTDAEDHSVFVKMK